MPSKIKTETKRHIEAFDYYYSLGEGRSYKQVGGRLGVSETSIENWARSFNWQKRVADRDSKNGKKIMAKTDMVIVNTKADYRKDVKLALQPVKAAINKAIVKNEETGMMEVRIPIAEAKDLSSVISSFVNLIKMDLLLMGEADSRTESNLTFNLLNVDLSGYPKKDDDGSDPV